MNNIVSTQRNKNFSGICGSSGVKGFLSSLGVDNIIFASPDNHLPKLDFVFYFEPWYDGNRYDADIDDTVNHPYTTLVSE